MMKGLITRSCGTAIARIEIKVELWMEDFYFAVRISLGDERKPLSLSSIWAF